MRTRKYKTINNAHAHALALVVAADSFSVSFPVANANDPNNANSLSVANTNKTQPTHAQIGSRFQAAAVLRDSDLPSQS